MQMNLTERLRSLPKLTVVDAHVAGMPARVVLGGSALPLITGETAFQKMLCLMNEHDHIRQYLLNEPRGYPPVCANVVLPSNNSSCEFAYVIMEANKIYPPMCGQLVFFLLVLFQMMNQAALGPGITQLLLPLFFLRLGW